MARLYKNKIFITTISIFLFFYIASPFPSFAQTVLTKANASTFIAEEIKRSYSTDEQLGAAANMAFGGSLTLDKIQVTRETLRAVLFHENLPTYLSEVMLPLMNTKVTRKDVSAAMMQGMMQLQVNGLTRLPTKRQATFIQHIVGMARWLPPEVCKAMYLGQISSEKSVAIEKRYTAALPIEQFTTVSNLYKEAQLAELTGYPDARIINGEQAKLAEKVYEEIVGKRLASKFSLAVLQSVSTDASTAKATDVCQVMNESILAILAMPEMYQSWKLTRYMESLK